ncbi:hypothetical protein BDZ89DRAFT_1045158 [Hymenopellis radicata]|nr:hypothetical protein BDZ89DRAFT_1045158 [Hymenopellis radicata]
MVAPPRRRRYPDDTSKATTLPQRPRTLEPRWTHKPSIDAADLNNNDDDPMAAWNLDTALLNCQVTTYFYQDPFMTTIPPPPLRHHYRHPNATPMTTTPDDNDKRRLLSPHHHHYATITTRTTKTLRRSGESDAALSADWRRLKYLAVTNLYSRGHSSSMTTTAAALRERQHPKADDGDGTSTMTATAPPAPQLPLRPQRQPLHRDHNDDITITTADSTQERRYFHDGTDTKMGLRQRPRHGTKTPYYLSPATFRSCIITFNVAWTGGLRKPNRRGADHAGSAGQVYMYDDKRRAWEMEEDDGTAWKGFQREKRATIVGTMEVQRLA